MKGRGLSESKSGVRPDLGTNNRPRCAAGGRAQRWVGQNSSSDNL